MNKILIITSTVIVLLSLTGCYHAFTETPRLKLVSSHVPPDIADILAFNLDQAYNRFNEKRKQLHEEQSNKHTATVITGISTLATGSLAGVFGITDQKVLSGLSGVLTLLSGSLSLMFVTPNQDDKILNNQWNDIINSKSMVETASIAYSFNPSESNRDNLQQALKELAIALNKFSVNTQNIQDFLLTM